MFISPYLISFPVLILLSLVLQSALVSQVRLQFNLVILSQEKVLLVFIRNKIQKGSGPNPDLGVQLDVRATAGASCNSLYRHVQCGTLFSLTLNVMAVKGI